MKSPVETSNNEKMAINNSTKVRPPQGNCGIMAQKVFSRIFQSAKKAAQRAAPKV
jgi:hypothetical protein